MSFKQHQFELLEKCSRNANEDCREHGETSNVSEYSKCNLEAIL